MCCLCLCQKPVAPPTPHPTNPPPRPIRVTTEQRRLILSSSCKWLGGCWRSGATVSECTLRGYSAQTPSLKLLLETHADRHNNKREWEGDSQTFAIQDELKTYSTLFTRAAFIMWPPECNDIKHRNNSLSSAAIWLFFFFFFLTGAVSSL